MFVKVSAVKKNNLIKKLKVSLHLPEKHSPEKHLPEKNFPECTLSRMYIWPNGYFPENLFSRIDTCQNVRLAEWTFCRKPIFQNYTFQNVHLAQWTFPKTYFPELALARIYIWPNRHFPENLFSRIDTCQNVLYIWRNGHFPENLFFKIKSHFLKNHVWENTFRER